MEHHEHHFVFSATDLSTFNACQHATLLDRETSLGNLVAPHHNDPAALLLKERGRDHEERYWRQLESPDGTEGIHSESVFRVPAGVPGSPEDWQSATQRTLEAMRAGHRVIAQAPLSHGRWAGIADFLLRVDHPPTDASRHSNLGDYHYEVVEAKLALDVTAHALFQLCVYTSIVETLQGCRPESMVVASPSRNRMGYENSPIVEHRFRSDDVFALFVHVRGRMEHFVATAKLEDVYPDPCDHCDSCRWSSRCSARRRDDDHLSLVAGLTRLHRQRLAGAGITTLTALGRISLPMQPRPRGLREDVLDRLHHQARLQLEARDAAPRYEWLPIEAGRGLSRLPAPSQGDIMLDFEADRYAEDGALYYLFGWVESDGDGALSYRALWADERTQERFNFETFIDRVMERRRTHPGLHIYHYAAFEKTALGEMSLRYLSRENEVDTLLREGVLVDLMPVVKQSLRAGIESYSIKSLEPFYGYERQTDLREATWALRNYELLRRSTGNTELPSVQRTIAEYNREDCESAWHLRAFLEDARESQIRHGAEILRQTATSVEPSETHRAQDGRVERLRAGLLQGVPEDPSAQTEDQKARRLLADLLDWHRREAKPGWWEYFRQKELTPEEQIDDGVAIGGLGPERDLGKLEGKRMRAHRYEYTFPTQDHGIRPGHKVECPATGRNLGEVLEVDHEARRIVVKRVPQAGAVPSALIRKFDEPSPKPMQDALAWLAEPENGGTHRAAWALLTRDRPKLRGGVPLRRHAEGPAAALERVAPLLDGTVLAVQGPPGAGKTYAGSRAIVALLRAGKTVGITAQSHHAIRLLLRGVHAAADAVGFDVPSLQKVTDDDDLSVHPRNRKGDAHAIEESLERREVSLVAGTAWLWAGMRNCVDVLVVDEAGQFSLANALAVSVAADSLVLLGDPQQLSQPTRASHPIGAGVSALEHILHGEPTIDPEQGLFLDSTWRLPPRVAAFTSEFFYRGRLHHHPDCAGQNVHSTSPWSGTGVRFEPVDHEGNVHDCPEEAQRVVEIVRTMLDTGSTWTDRDGTSRPLFATDILVVAPYNAQVHVLSEQLRRGQLAQVRVGTVDKFQGQEAPVVLYSMTTSNPEDAPRGLEFLFSPARLNVATSRSQGLAIVLASPKLLEAECKTPRHMRWLNGLCGVFLSGVLRGSS